MHPHSRVTSGRGSRFFWGIFYGFFCIFYGFLAFDCKKPVRITRLGIFYGLLGLDVRHLYASQGWAICLHLS